MKPLKIGLVLSGGGAKGAYQIGLFRALAQLAVAEQVTALSGCSIGALNALLFAGGEEARWRAAWQGLNYESFLGRDEEKQLPAFPQADTSDFSIKELVSLIHKKAAEINSLPQMLASNDLAPFSQTGLRRLLEEYVDFKKLERVPPYLWVCAYNMEREEPEYFSLSGMAKEDAVDLALASAAIPLVFPPVEYRGSHYCDGGIVPPYSQKKNADKIPIKAIRGAGCNLVIICYLSYYDKVDLSGFPTGTSFLELYPSSPLELIPGAGTLNLDPETLLENQQMGYNDSLAAIAPLLLELSRGESGERALTAHALYNKELLAARTAAKK
ncbi:MAG: patatin-like phospholipase family protein [Angelakisella sp.]